MLRPDFLVDITIYYVTMKSKEVLTMPRKKSSPEPVPEIKKDPDKDQRKKKFELMNVRLQEIIKRRKGV